MVNIEYIKSYKDKELRHYILAYLIICIASIGLNTSFSLNSIETLNSVFKMLMTDALLCAVCVLASIFNELFSENAKIKLVYGALPSDTVFTNIATDSYKESGFDIDFAKQAYAYLNGVSAKKQTAQWNALLRKCKDNLRINVIDAERAQLMMRDICLSTISLLIMTIIAVITLSINSKDICEVLSSLWFPIVYLLIMTFVTRIAANNRAKRLISLVIKNDIQDKQETNNSV